MVWLWMFDNVINAAKELFAKLNWRMLHFAVTNSGRRAGQMDKKLKCQSRISPLTQLWGQYCKQCFNSNTNNFDPCAPTDPNIYLFKFTSSYCLKRQSRPLPGRVWMLLKDVPDDWLLNIWLGCLSSASLILFDCFHTVQLWTQT